MPRSLRPPAGLLRSGAVALALAVSSAAASATLAPSALAAFGQSARATSTFTTDTLAPPSNLSAGLCLLGSVTLTWTATPSTWADGYELRWGTTSGGPYPSSATTATTSHVVTGLSALTTYRFVVRAYDGNWRSSYTNEVSVLC